MEVWPIEIPAQPVLELAYDDVSKGPARVRCAQSRGERLHMIGQLTKEVRYALLRK